MTTTPTGALRPTLPPQAERHQAALTIALSATDLLEQLTLGRLERSLENITNVSESLHQAASLIGHYAPCEGALSGIATDAKLAAEMLFWAEKMPNTLTPDRCKIILATLYRATDQLAMIDLADTVNRKEAQA